MHILAPSAWAAHNFACVDCGDERRTKRLIRVAEALAERPRGTLTETFTVHADVDAAYRLFDAAQVTHDAVIASHCLNTRRAFKPGGRYLVIEDTTTLDYTDHKSLEGAGRIGDDNGRGFFVHSALAVQLVNDQPELVGLYGQQVWARADDFRCEGRPKAERLTRPRESQRWGQLDELPPDVHATFIADREADIYECLQGCMQRGWHFVMRACQNRALLDDEGATQAFHLFESVAKSPVLGEIDVHLRSRPGKKARTARLELRAKRVTLRPPWRPADKPQPLELTVVEAMETGRQRSTKGRRTGMQKDKPLHWILLTDGPVTTFEQARETVETYRHRWLVEEYFKALKTGCSVENSQLRKASRLLALLGVLSVVGVRLLAMKLLGRSRPDEAVPKDILGPYGLRILRGHKKKTGTWKELVRAIAGMGGFQGRKGDGDPGWITIWRGFQNLWLSIQGAHILIEQNKCGE